MSQAAAGVEAAIEAFREGEPVLVHDAADREGETDLVYPASAVTPEAVSRLRNDAGGLVCVALSDAVADAFDLPFLGDALDHPASEAHELGYDERSSFSLPVNHRDTYTGITDEDRALTITKLAEAAREAQRASEGASGETASDPESVEFAAEFRSPGHVHLLRAAPNLLADREGHTELGIALAAAADREPAVVVCEMLDDETGEALAPEDAQAYAERYGLAYLEGSDVVEALG
ncbi:3,4-dihydroxy-2-butanone-4-phosphate synthase [Halorussus salilacus]|uniref:3,4-dihydroxy-2-butanone-4-phosphate synthase n=1 Tax=Halorussus salilacus TaxID=2953750 RepID=UPI0020A22F04|nr:3,4-dihydroxy-2-butanone-4-phosphate synthase [Halorussus salilacus]USZ66891.1 3,4-dihydroxy-2-butanone-4-phosphate synthase [Halorussus salilacus]